MKFSLFAHPERYDNSVSHRELLEQLTELTLIAERGGFETVWLGEHHAMEYTIAPNPFLNLAYLAAQTTRIRLGTGTIIAPFWHPIRLAGEAGLCDVVSNGRLDLGIARGAYLFEYDRLLPGLEPMGAGARMREMVPVLQKLFAGDYAHDGEFWKFPTSTPVPRPIQQPHPPMWIAARDPMSHQFAIANRCHVQVTSLAAGDDEVRMLMERFDAACQANPSVPRPNIMMLMHTYVAETEDELAQGAVDLQKFYTYFGKWARRERPVKDGFMETIRQEDLDAAPNFAPDKLRQNLVIGTPAQTIERLKSYEAMGYDQYSLWLDNHMDFDRKRRSLQLFIDQVMPAFAA